MIKQIQFRGISRTPSDRMTKDGGLAECLNLQLDHGELVPMSKPIPVNLSEYTGAESEDFDFVVDYFFIHKGTYYENIIARVCHDLDVGVDKPTRMVAFCKGRGQQELFDLDEEAGEKVTDVAAVGNTLIITTTEKMHYCIFKDGQYNYKGDHIPVPQLRFYMNPDSINREPSVSGSTPVPSDIDTETVSFRRGTLERYHDKGVELNISDWGIEANAYRVRTDLQRAVLDAINTTVSKRVTDANAEGKCIYPVFLRYALRLYDGSLYGCSAPILMGGELNNYISLKLISLLAGTEPHSEGGTTVNVPVYDVGASVKTPAKYSIIADFTYNNIEKEDWEDIVEGIELYVSTPILPYVDIDAVQLSDREADADNDWYSAKANLDPVRWQNRQEELLLAHQTTYFAKRWGLDELADLTQVALTDINYSGDWLGSQQAMVETYNSVHKIYGDKVSTYNNRLLLEGAKMELYSGYPFFPATYPISSAGNDDTFSFVWHIMVDGEEKTVITKNPNGDRHMSPMMADSYEQSFIWWFSYPDARAVSLDLYQETSGYVFIRRFPAKAFTEANVAYVFAGFGTTPSLPTLNTFSGDFPDDDPVAVLPDQVLMSESSNPFIFPAGGVIDFDGAKILGTAMATKALSEGQFGQFPLYVFTSTGIWSLTLNSEGAFVAKHSVTRDVALKGTIVPIDQAIIFTSEKGVMLLSGSDVVNISPEMNGRHYVLDDEAAQMLKDTSKKVTHLAYASTRPESFMEFMKSATPAYDYAGERIIFACEKYNGYLYIYRLNTGTWHKMTILPHAATAAWASGSTKYYVKLNSAGDDVQDVYQWIYNEYQNFGSRYPWKLIDNIPVVIPRGFTDISAAQTFADNLAESGADVEVVETPVFYSSVVRPLNGYPDALFVVKEFSSSQTNYLPVAMIYDFSTVLDADGTGGNAMGEGLIVTRAMDFDERDIRKVLRDLRIRGMFSRANAKYILLGSFDGINWHRLSSLRGGSFKLFRIAIITTLSASERLSWIEVDYQTRFTNRMR